MLARVLDVRVPARLVLRNLLVLLKKVESGTAKLPVKNVDIRVDLLH